MVTRLLFAPARSRQSAAGGSGIAAGLISLITLGALATPGCEKVPLTAPAGTVITLVVSTNVLPINGSVDLTAVLIENGTTRTGSGTDTTTTGSAGTPVHNGTLVSFTTSLGRIEPAEARTSNGRVTVKLIADGRSGTATVTAFSGAASEALEVSIGAAAAERVSVTATPATVPAGGGTVTIGARVEDASGNALLGVPVNFTTSAGTLAATSAVTNEGGVAAVSLSTTTDATVVASAGGKSSSTSVKLRSRSTITMASPNSTIFVGAPASFTVTPGPGVAMADVSIDFDDGRIQSLGAISSATPVVHFFDSGGVFHVMVRGTDVDGGSATASGDVAVIPWQFAAGSLPTSGTVNTIFSFSVTGISTTVPIDRYEWNFGDGTVKTSSTASVSHGYSTPGVKTIVVTVHPLYGAPKSTSFDVSVIVS